MHDHYRYDHTIMKVAGLCNIGWSCLLPVQPNQPTLTLTREPNCIVTLGNSRTFSIKIFCSKYTKTGMYLSITCYIKAIQPVYAGNSRLRLSEAVIIVLQLLSSPGLVLERRWLQITHILMGKHNSLIKKISDGMTN